MKLNLLPTYVSKEKQGRFAVVGAVLIAVAGLAIMLFLTRTSREAVQVQQDRINAARNDAQLAVAKSKEADTVMNDARGLILNMTLAQAMDDHNKVYPDLFDDVRKYIPNFYRISSLQAVPNGPDSCTVTMTGYLKSFQEYADLMVALLRIPGATAVSRSGYQLADPVVPALVPEDQTGRKIKPGEARVPDNAQDRLDLQIAQARVNGFLNQGGFGTTDRPVVRGAMPDYSTVTVAVVLTGRNIQTPDPRASLGEAAKLWGATAGTASTGAPTTVSSTPPPSAPPTPGDQATTRRGRGAKSGDTGDE